MRRRSILAAGFVPLLPGVVPADTTAIVVGSTEAGAMAASRLAQAGIRTTVLGHSSDPALSYLEQPRGREWDMVYPPALYDELDWKRARRSYPRPAVTAGPVTEIHLASGGFQVRTAHDTYTADFVFMAAGTIETTSLLVTARERGWLPRLGNEVGKGFGTNGAFLVSWLNARTRPAPHIDDANRIAPTAISGESAPVQVILSVTSERGEIRYDTSSGTAKVHWPYAPMESTGEKAARDLVTRLWWQGEGRRGRLLRGLPHYDRTAGLGASTTRHPLGGMVMGKATDHNGRSLDYPNLYCLDGSVLPGTTCLTSPALTIAANAERIMDRFLAAHA